MTVSRIQRLSLTHFRSYRAASVDVRADLVVLGMVAAALAIAAVAAGLWRLREYRVILDES